MLQNLLCEEGDLVEVESAALPVAKFSKFQPLSTDFLDITNPKAILENALRNFACLTTGDCVAIRYNEKTYELKVLETRPGNAVSIIECDMDVEFAAPEDYVEPVKPKRDDKMDVGDTLHTEETEDVSSFVPFVGLGNRLDGKTSDVISETKLVSRHRRGIPDYDFEIGTIDFIRTPTANGISGKNNSKSFVPFGGSGTTIRASRKKDDN
jgi:ubiquitin fusion degradation protein 1